MVNSDATALVGDGRTLGKLMQLLMRERSDPRDLVKAGFFRFHNGYYGFLRPVQSRSEEIPHALEVQEQVKVLSRCNFEEIQKLIKRAELC